MAGRTAGRGGIAAGDRRVSRVRAWADRGDAARGYPVPGCAHDDAAG